MNIDVDSNEGNALFDALLGSDFDYRLSRVYRELGLAASVSGKMEIIP